MDDGFELFRECLLSLNDPQRVNEANEKLDFLRSNNTPLFLTYAAKLIINFCNQNQEGLESINSVIVSLAAINSACTPKRIKSVKEIREYWYLDDPIANQMRPLVKESILKSITSQFLPIRRMACATLVAILQIERTNWIEIMPTLLTTTSTTDPINIGSIMIFLDIFNMNVIPNQIQFKEIDKELYIILLDTIFNVLANLDPNISTQEDKINASLCLKYLISKGKDELFSMDIIEKILNVICFVFQNDQSLTSELYRELHFVMLEIINSLYNHATFFTDQIYKITETGINSSNIDFQIISYDFWSLVCEIEKKIFILKSRNSGKDLVYHNIIERYSIYLINYGIRLFVAINPAIKFSRKDDEFQSVEYVCQTLSQIFDNLLRSKNLLGQNFTSIRNVIEELLSASEDSSGDEYKKQHYTAVLMMRSLLFDHEELIIYDLIESKILSIIDFAQSDTLYLSEASLKLLTRFIDRKDSILKNPQIVESIFKVFQVCSTYPNYIAMSNFGLIYSFCNHLPPRLIDLNFDCILSILAQKFADFSLLQSDAVENLHKAIEILIFKSGENTQAKLIQLLVSSIQVFKASLSRFNNGFVMHIVFGCSDQNLDNTNPDLALFYDQDRSFLLRFIILIIRTLKVKPEEIITEFINILFQVLQNRTSFLFEDSLGAIADISETIGKRFLPFAHQYVQIINDCFFSQDLECIKTASFCFSILCQCLGNEIGMYVKDQVMNMYQLITSLDEYQQMMVLPDILIAFSKIVLSLKDFILSNIDFILEIFNFSHEMSNFRINIDNQNEYEFAERLYISLCSVFISIIKILPVEITEEKNFINAIKKKVFPLIEKISFIHTTDKELLEVSVHLLSVIGNLPGKTPRKMNSFFHKDYVFDLFNWIQVGCVDVFTKRENDTIQNVYQHLYHL